MINMFFLDQDNDGHWYVVPIIIEKLWREWLDLDQNLEEAWTQPAGVIAVGGSYTSVKFKEFNYFLKSYIIFPPFLR